MEDTNNPEFRTWLEKQHQFTLSVLNKIPNQDKLYAEMKEMEKEVGSIYNPLSSGKYGTVFLAEIPGNSTPIYYFQRNGKKNLEFIIDPSKYMKNRMLDPYLSSHLQAPDKTIFCLI